MKPIAKLVGILLVALSIVFTILFATGHMSLFFQEYFGVRSQNVETKVFKETEMYNEGMTQQLAKAKKEYELADTERRRKALASYIRHNFADYEAERLPKGLKDFLIEIRGY